jgi:hypothetical protein
MSKMKTRVESDRILELHKKYRKKIGFMLYGSGLELISWLFLD